MALYVPAGARTRRLVLVGVAALVVGLLLGYLVGRASSPGLPDEVAAVQDLAADAATALERLPIEYEQLLAGEGGESTDTLIDAIERARTQLDIAYTAAIWLPDDSSAATDVTFDGLVVAVEDSIPADAFASGIAEAVGQIESAFGIIAGQPT